MKRLAYWGGRVAHFRVASVTVPNDLPVIRFIEELPYVALFMVIMGRFVDLPDEEFATHSLDYVKFQRPFDQHHMLTNFDYLLEETFFEHR